MNTKPLPFTGRMLPKEQGIRHVEHLVSFMREAIGEAEKGWLAGEVPVGAILLDRSNGIIARGHNRCVLDADPTAHAEIVVIRQAARIHQNYRLTGATLVVTVEPCIMCMGAIINARIDTLIFGAFDEKSGAGGSVFNLAQDRRFNHRLKVVHGVLEEECRGLMQDFFTERR
jgi:tRNA(adenine34) deaminase